LADFGIARALNEAHRLTATGTLMATVAFAAPEVIQGDPADHRADIYSLGCTLFRLLTNRNPFQGSLTAVMMGHLSSAPPPVTDFAPALPAAINGVLYTAMAKDPQHRYPTAGALAAAVAAAVSDSATAQTVQAPLLTPPATPHYIAPHDHGRTPQWQLHAPTFPAAAPVGPGAPPPQPPRRRAKPGRLWALSAAAAALVAALVAAIVLWPRDHQAPYPAADFVHEFGTTHLSQRPSAVAALTLADADTVMSLGVSPVAILAPSGQVPSWLQPLLHATKLLGDARSATVAPLHPDLIIDTDASATSYPDLAAIAPTITRPVNQRWTPQSRLTWIADILGEQSAGKSLLNDAAVAQAQARQDHPAFTGKTLTVFEFSASGLSAALPSAPNAGFFVGLGFSYVSTPGSGTSADDPRQTVAIDVNDLYMPRSEITVVIRTDPQAGGGGYSGLPSALTGTGSHVVVVDDPNTVAALDSLGPAATTYLTTTFVPTLADQIH
jgi:serine/threonine-protein kinase